MVSRHLFVCLFQLSGMGLIHVPGLLLVAAVLTVSVVFGQDENIEDYSWTRQSVPVLLDTQTEPLNTPLFRGHKEDEAGEGTKTIGCRHSRPLADRREQERLLGYETVYENGTRTHTDVSVQSFNWTSGERPAHLPSRTRRKRQVYGADGRFVISDSHFITNYPFSAAVRVSTRCSGILVSTKHVLTAAHCIHDGKDYLQSIRGVKVGVLQVKTKRGRGGRRRGGRRRGGNGEEKERGEAQMTEEGQEQNRVDGDGNGGKVRRRKGRKKTEGVADEGGRGGQDGDGKGLSRKRRSADPKNQISFRWARVKQIQIPQGWIQTKGSTNSVTSDYNYAVLELKRPIKQKYMELGVAPPTAPMTRVHFSAYDSDRSMQDGHSEETVVYRFCTVEEESDDLIYQRCDAQPGANGAGVYIRLRQEAGDAGGKGKWQRRVIGVFSGHQWVEEDGGEQRDYNVAVRITPLKYAQICHWIHKDPSLCTEV